MASGIAVILGWAPPYDTIEKALGLRLPTTTQDWARLRHNGIDDTIWADNKAQLNHLNQQLGEARNEVFLEMGFVYAPQPDGCPAFDTPLGKRSFSPLVLSLSWDPDEYHEPPEASTFGVRLSGHYSSIFLDWRDGRGLSPVRLDADTQRMIDIARRAIIKRLPVFETAYINVVEKHY